jgi:ankyrin repeat protein
MAAAAKGHTDVVNALIAAKADITLKDNNNLTAFDIAKQNGHADIADLLNKASVDALFAVHTGISGSGSGGGGIKQEPAAAGSFSSASSGRGGGSGSLANGGERKRIKKEPQATVQIKQEPKDDDSSSSDDDQ